MEDILVPIGICVVLPVMIVWLVNRTRQNETNRKTELMLKALESGVPVDAAFYRLQNNKTIKERLLKRLTAGCIFALTGLTFLFVGITNGILWNGNSAVVPATFGGLFLAIGVSLFITFFVGKKLLAKEIAAEEKAFEDK